MKVMNCTANIYFNQQCQARKIIPNYAKINIPHTSPAAFNMQQKMQHQRIKDEIKFLYRKKQQLNTELNRAHL
jgi:hypothetical protein